VGRRDAGPAFFAYADNYLIEVKFGVVMDVEASRAIRQAEVGAAKIMIERTEERFGLKPERLAADTAYGSAATLGWIVTEKGIAPHIPSGIAPSVMTAPSPARTSPSTRRATSTSARRERRHAILPGQQGRFRRSGPLPSRFNVNSTISSQI
jgi:hypothetical protein